MKKNLSVILFSFIIISANIFVGCEDRDKLSINLENTLLFTGRLYESADIDTRGPASSAITREDYSGWFYMDMVTKGEHFCGQYYIPEKSPGVLRSFGEQDSLIWKSKYDEHTFYCWTMPWLERDSYIDEKVSNEPTIISFEETSEMYKIINENQEERYVALEKFIGAKGGPLSYSEYGEYVNLRFQHLVSKIKLKSVKFSYTDADGKLQSSDVNGKIIFEGLPAQGIFDRNGQERPEVKADPDSRHVEYSFNGSTSKTLYVCPDIDFSKVKFRIQAQTADAGDFLGDFSALEFLRDGADWWDETHPDPHVLYAGEVMTMSIILRQGIGTDVSLSISNWTNQPAREASSYPYEGIYDSSQWNDIYNSFPSGTYNNDEELENTLFKKFGNQDTGEYDLFTDIDGLKQRAKIGKRYVLNGMGHTLSFSSYYDDSGPIVRISRMRDIYLVGPDGLTLYIDENFNIYTVDEFGAMSATGYSLDPLPDKMSSYIIDFSTGKPTPYSRY